MGSCAVPAGRTGPGLIELIWQRSPNFGSRRGAARPDIIVLHYTAMASAEAAADWLCNPEAQVSAHYVLGQDGGVRQLVPETGRAWHAGAGAWGAVTDVNSRSIGIEIDNDGTAPFPDLQMQRLCDLVASVSRRWGIRPERVIGHSDMAPGRKIDPGRHFDWGCLSDAGLAIALGTAGEDEAEPDPAQFVRDLRAGGYTAEASEDALLSAFRLRHRPSADGPLDGRDCALAAQLARRFPVDRPGPIA